MLIVKVPGINGLGKTKGCEKAGNAVLDALKEIYSNEQGKPIDVRLLNLEEIHLDNSNIELSTDLIYKNSLEIFKTQDKAIFLGGDHSISYAIGRGFLEYCKKQNSGEQDKEPCLIVFDAHPDCMPSVSKKCPTHEEWLRALVEQGFPSENILLVGVRNSDKEEINFLRKNKIRVITINQIMENIEDICEIIMEFATSGSAISSGAISNGDKEKEVYISIDIDIIDPAFAPATSYIEPGGLTSRDFIYMVQRIKRLRNLKTIDLVEINAEKDVAHYNNLTLKLGAKILSEII